MNLSEFLSEFQLEAGEKLDIIASQLLRLERDATNPQPVREMFLAAHTIKGGASMLRLSNVEGLAHAVEDLLSSFRDQQRTLDGTTADLVFQSIDHLRTLISTASTDGSAAEPDGRVISLAAQLRANASGQSVPTEILETLEPTPRRRRALLVDDSPTVLEMHRMLLEDAGFKVDICHDGQVALAQALVVTFDLVVSGVQNKTLSGFELCSALRNTPAYRDVLIVLMSADADPELSRRAAHCGAAALVRKGSLRDERLSEVLAELTAAAR